MSVYTLRGEKIEKKKNGKILKFRTEDEAAGLQEKYLHKYGKCGALCDTDTRGHATPQDRDPLELMVNAPDGVIPLWDDGVTLRWRFQEQSLLQFENSDEIKTYVRKLFAEGIQEWGDAVPVRFKEAQESWDFELVILAEQKCSINGCTLASAFFPDAGRHELNIYPTLFSQSRSEQIETMAHELGHIFGLRHFFADVRETAWPFEQFGTHSKFSIMNYGTDSRMTDNDRHDLKTLYAMARSGKLKKINGTPVKLVRPFSETRLPANPSIELIAARR